MFRLPAYSTPILTRCFPSYRSYSHTIHVFTFICSCRGRWQPFLPPRCERTRNLVSKGTWNTMLNCLHALSLPPQQGRSQLPPSFPKMDFDSSSNEQGGRRERGGGQPPGRSCRSAHKDVGAVWTKAIYKPGLSLLAEARQKGCRSTDGRADRAGGRFGAGDRDGDSCSDWRYLLYTPERQVELNLGF